MSTDAQAIFAAETALREGPVPDRIPDAALEAPGLTLSADAFLMRLPNGLGFHYARGAGVVVDRPPGVAEAEVELYHSGSVCGAVAWINGLTPLHASGVVQDGRVHAATGVSGAGKSTLATALCALGRRMQADDLLVLDLRSDEAPPACLPGRRSLKLWRDALALTGASPGAQVRPDMEKFFVEPEGGRSDRALPLDRIYILKDSAGAPPAIRELSATEALRATPAMVFRPHFYRALATPEQHWRILTRLATKVRFFEFSRPIDPARFVDGVRAIDAHMRGAP